MANTNLGSDAISSLIRSRNVLTLSTFLRMLISACRVSRSFLLRLVSPAKQVRLLFRRDITARVLVRANPDDHVLAAVEFHLPHLKRKPATGTDFVAVVSVHERVTPYDQRVSAPFALNALF